LGNDAPEVVSLIGVAGGEGGGAAAWCKLLETGWKIAAADATTAADVGAHLDNLVL